MTITTHKQYIDSLKKYAAIINRGTTKPCERCNLRKLAVQIWVWENKRGADAVDR